MLKNLCYHTHNIYCDGNNSVIEMIEYAVLQGIRHIGISSHAPFKVFNKWSILERNLPDYFMEIEKAKQYFKNKIEVFVSLEIDYIPNETYDFDYFRKKFKLDYTIGSVHLVKNPANNQLWFIDGDKEICQQNFKNIFDNDIKLAVKTYYSQIRKMIELYSPDIIAHLDKVVMNTAGVLFNENEAWYKNEILQTLEIIKESGAIMEVNTRGIYKNKWATTFPSPEILKVARKLNIPIVISSDAHSVDEIMGGYELARSVLEAASYSTQSYFVSGKWEQLEL